MDINEKFRMARSLSGNSQLEYIAEHQEFKDILKWAYNPFKKYNIKINFNICMLPDNNKICNEDGILNQETTALLDKLASRELSGDSAKDAVKDFISRLEIGHVELMCMIINKDLRLNIGVKSINKIFPGLIPWTEDGYIDIPIMLLKNFAPSRITYPCLAAAKYDGVRGRFKSGNLYSRSKKRFKGLDHIEQALNKFCDDQGIEKDFDGEIIIPGGIFDEASGSIRDHNPTPEAVYKIFDIPSDNRNKMARWNHLNNMKEVIETVDSRLQVIDHTHIRDEIELQIFYYQCIADGYEGIVIYLWDSKYEDKRSYEWMRMVPLLTIDCKIAGFFEGNGKLAGSLGGIIVEYKSKDVKVGTGFSDQLRSEIWNNPEKFIGKIAEIECKEITKAGSMRQPRFKKLRTDKTEPNFS